ncbi:MAG: hypothetical protein ACAI35_06635 [Candidatus Methylacidiphilales bacterium]|nr:hypothetical protein [Candidatus Methylacidiphilales bacterium]
MSLQDPPPGTASASKAVVSARKIWGWIAIASVVLAVVSLVVSFYATMHYFSSAGQALSLSIGPGEQIMEQKENARGAVHSHTLSALFSLSGGLCLFVIATVGFLVSVAQYLSLHARSVAAKAAEPVAADLSEPSEADTERFATILNRPAEQKQTR